MSKPSTHADFYRVLDLIEDYLLDGFRQVHNDLPAVEQSQGTHLERIAGRIRQCQRCELHLSRTNAVPGEGVRTPLVLIIGEGPGADEDRTGQPFVGRAGQYLDKWLRAIELDRNKDCFITNIIKCRPPYNRDPKPEEIEACLPYLEEQIDRLRPRVIFTVGRISTQILLGAKAGIGSLRGKIHSFGNVPLIATYHPVAVLRDSSLRAAVWEDLKILLSVLKDG
ncbi:Type-4 uracil-DNA glycosylase [subsurface metagenome]